MRVASTQEAKNGNNNSSIMTPRRTKELVEQMTKNIDGDLTVEDTVHIKSMLVPALDKYRKALTIGTLNGKNLTLGYDCIQSRNNGGNNTLYMQYLGGRTQFNGDANLVDGELIFNRYSKYMKLIIESATWASLYTDCDRIFLDKPTYIRGDAYGGTYYNRRFAYADESEPKLLTDDLAMYMHGTQTITLNETVSSQKHGIVLIWSAYSGGSAQNYDFNYIFISKMHIQLFPGSGISMFLTNSDGSLVGTKYLYVGDSAITGNDNNDDAAKTVAGYTNTPNHFVLRYVVGV